MSDSPAGWGSAREMSPFEVMMWRAEGDDPRFRSPVLAVELLDAKPDWDRLVAAVDWATRMVPRLRERIRWAGSVRRTGSTTSSSTCTTTCAGCGSPAPDRASGRSCPRSPSSS